MVKNNDPIPPTRNTVCVSKIPKICIDSMNGMYEALTSY